MSDIGCSLDSIIVSVDDASSTPTFEGCGVAAVEVSISDEGCIQYKGSS